MTKKVTLITGGIRSGKSRHALNMARKKEGQKVFLATATPLDEEMSEKIQRHKEERGDDFLTVEEPLYLAKAIKEQGEAGGVLLIDCLCLWVHNLLDHWDKDHKRIEEEQKLFLEVLENPPMDVIIVTNETGWGIIPANPLARQFMNELGFLNQHVAGLSHEVIMMVAGIPQVIK